MTPVTPIRSGRWIASRLRPGAIGAAPDESLARVRKGDNLGQSQRFPTATPTFRREQRFTILQ